MSEGKSAKAYRTISEVAESLGVPQHVLRFWETKFPAVKPLKRGGNRRYYRPEDIELLQVIHRLLHVEGYTIKGAQKLLKEQGARQLVEALLSDAEGAAGQPVPLALAASAAAAAKESVAEAAAPEPAAATPAAAQTRAKPKPEPVQAGETPAVEPAALAAGMAVLEEPLPVAEPSDGSEGLNGNGPHGHGAGQAGDAEIAVAAALMPAAAEVATLPESAPTERQRRSAVVDELLAIRARLAEALGAAAAAR